AQAMGLDGTCASATEASTAVIERIRQLLKEVSVPDRLSTLGITRDMIPALSKKAMEDACHLLNPRPCTESDMAALYEQAL
ncbi:MAG TPA: iron-containing alcohol dehydrogenase, partial [Terriglobia bacterium]|nr:iron-containing alcohol dehydrogenase [Terriglobia bacterium]